MSKRAVDIRVDEKAPQIAASQTKADRQAFVETYAKRNPVKYALKEQALKAWVEAA